MKTHPDLPAESGDRGRIWALGLAVLLLATAGAFVLGREATQAVLLPASLGRAGAAESPDLRGRNLEDARQRAEDAGSALDVLGLAYGSEVDSGEVLAQFPPEGMPLESGEPIEVLVGAGPGVRRVPDVRGLQESDARSLLEEVGLPVGASRRIAAEGFDDGSVAGTEPEIGSPLPRDDSIVLLVGRGGVVVEVPDVRGRTRDEAARELADAQLAVGKLRGADDGEPGTDDVVAGQDPPAGGLARSGSAVDLRMGPRVEGAQE